MTKATFLLLWAALSARSALTQDCALHPQMEGTCLQKDCIPRVQTTSVAWGDVTAKTFYVRWEPASKAKCYYIELLNGYTVNPIKTVSCHRGTVYEFTDLRPSTIYGVRVSVIDSNCRRGQPGNPARTRTMWAPTTKPTTKPFVTRTPKPGACGRGFFTCRSDSSECLKMKKWCNRVLDCEDGSDERGCPGGCEEIDIEFKSGNYSCTRWGSPGSVCSFDCQGVHTRDGAKYTYCSRKKATWSKPIPTCRLKKTALLSILNDEATGESVTVQWAPVEGAVRYTFVAVEQTAPHSSQGPIMRTMTVDEADCCQTAILELKPETEFKIILTAVDEDDVKGMPSDPVFARTATKLDAEFPEEPGNLIDEKTA